ncbi:MAG: prepilin peptidase [Planctomycetaceae bacterium]|nr:prepilin peptidase [Planctomycetaceae bacterium]MCB9953250.1 prepilin peptidase [Planctomycetaceae bacterium]
MEDTLLWPFRHLPVPLLALIFGVVVGAASAWMTKRDLQDCHEQPGRWPLYFGVLGAALASGLTIAMISGKCQKTEVVLPSEFWEFYRLPYQLVLVTLLVSMTATDLRSFYILDRTNLIGVCVGISLATLSGELQMEHLWVDWTPAIDQIRPPYIPDWLDKHRHLHGLAWSVTGAAVGAGLTWLVQVISRWVLGKPALGTGDIFLMATAGSFIGWQPVLIAFAFAPLLAVIIGVVVRLINRQAAIPYGPFLAGGVVLVLFFWGDIQTFKLNLTSADTNDPRQVFELRRFLGDAVALATVAGGSLTLLVVLLGGLRWYKSGPPETSE